MSPAAMRCLEEHAWPGNVRELENVLERAFLFAEGPVIQHISLDLTPRLGHAPVNEAADLRQLKKMPPTRSIGGYWYRCRNRPMVMSGRWP